MKRRSFIMGLAASAVSPITTARAQQPARLPRIGILATSPPSNTPSSQALLDELRKFGWIDGQTVTIEWKITAGQIERFDELAAELVRAKTDVIIAPNPNSVLAARRATASIPIVMVNTSDPVQLGIVASLARPGGNVTGTCSLSPEVSAKQVQLIREILPGLSQLAIMTVATNPWHPYAIKAIESAARSLGVDVTIVTANNPADFDGFFAALGGDQTKGALVLADPMTFFHRATLAELSIRHRVATVYALREYVESGGLISYWADQVALYQRTAAYVDKLLRGERVEDLPIEQPTQYELVINLKTAKAIGLEVPTSLLARADEVIE